MMENYPNTPLDFEAMPRVQQHIPEKYRNTRLFFELIPILLIVIGLVLKKSDHEWWRPLIIIGGFLASVTYLLISFYLFRLEKYKGFEIFLSFICGMLFPLGFMGVVLKMRNLPWGEQIMFGAIAAAAVLFVLNIILFIFNIHDERASRFYRNILARLLVFSAILLMLYPF